MKWAAVKPEFGQSIASERCGIEQVDIAHAARRAQFNKVARRLGEPELPPTLETLTAKIEAAGWAWSLTRVAPEEYEGTVGLTRKGRSSTPLAALAAAARERGIG